MVSPSELKVTHRNILKVKSYLTSEFQTFKANVYYTRYIKSIHLRRRK